MHADTAAGPWPVTLFTGQWADLPLDELAMRAARWGYDGLELACDGDHFDIRAALTDDRYARAHRQRLARHGLSCDAISVHLIGQAVCDPIDVRHRAILPRDVWGDGDPRGVQRRAAARVCDAARAAGRFGVQVVTGFTGSPVWHMLYGFPPPPDGAIERGYETFAEAWTPILDTFAREGVRFALEVHPAEIAYDAHTTRETLRAIGGHPAFGLNFDPSHFVHQFIDIGAFIAEFAERILHVHVKDTRRTLDGRTSVLGSHLPQGDDRRGWNFTTPGHGDVNFAAMLAQLERIGYQGPLSVEWEDYATDREQSAQESVRFLRALLATSPA